jgi:meso-butanediol dehydrogenase/(S,S)-butanediol dehydrogenase/diacetyl reductase
MTLTNKIALVTGGGRGIGRGIALALAQAGADVAIAEVDRVASAAQHYRDATVSGVAAARQVADEVRALGRRATVIGADVTQWAQVTAMVDTVVRELGGLDVLVCNAGVVHISPVERLAEEAFDLTMAVNVKGVFLACKAAIPVLKGRPGASFINVDGGMELH